jgi:lactosylceramide 4-alpha-galactosyltransferase
VLVSYLEQFCYLDRERQDKLTLENAGESFRIQEEKRKIFFHETSCTSNGIIKLNSRQSCAICFFISKLLFKI